MPRRRERRTEGRRRKTDHAVHGESRRGDASSSRLETRKGNAPAVGWGLPHRLLFFRRLYAPKLQRGVPPPLLPSRRDGRPRSLASAQMDCPTLAKSTAPVRFSLAVTGAIILIAVRTSLRTFACFVAFVVRNRSEVVQRQDLFSMMCTAKSTKVPARPSAATKTNSLAKTQGTPRRQDPPLFPFAILASLRET